MHNASEKTLVNIQMKILSHFLSILELNEPLVEFDV